MRHGLLLSTAMIAGLPVVPRLVGAHEKHKAAAPTTPTSQGADSTRGRSVALLLPLAGRRWPEVHAVSAAIVWMAAAAAGAALLMGRAQEGAFHETPKAWLVVAHETYGLAALIALSAWTLLGLWKSARRVLRLVGGAAALLVLAAAFLGGLVAHGA